MTCNHNANPGSCWSCWAQEEIAQAHALEGLGQLQRGHAMATRAALGVHA